MTSKGKLLRTVAMQLEHLDEVISDNPAAFTARAGWGETMCYIM